MRKRGIKDYTKCVGLSNSKDGERGKIVGEMGLGGKVRNMLVDLPIKHPSEMLSKQVDIRD